jgi:DNA replication initiation complex subunit (GINS family)
MGEVNITYETLFELLRREKMREELQKLDDLFLMDVLNYIKEKKEHLKSLETKEDLFAAEEKRKADIQHDNIRKILKEIYERREKKIIAMALDKSRTCNSVVDTSVLLKEEKILYENLVRLFNSFRKGILFNILETREPFIDMPGFELSAGEPLEPENCEELREESNFEKNKKVKIIEFIPKFVGSDLKEYGPFDNNDITALPEDIAELLIDKGSAEDVN